MTDNGIDCQSYKAEACPTRIFGQYLIFIRILKIKLSPQPMINVWLCPRKQWPSILIRDAHVSPQRTRQNVSQTSV